MKVKKIKILLFAILFSYMPVSNAQQAINERVENILSKMTLEEKIGQMNQENYSQSSNDLVEWVKKGMLVLF